MHNRWIRRIVAAMAATALIGVAGCGSDDNAGGGDATASGAPVTKYDLAGAKLKVGSKEFTEQLILGKIAVKALEANGADVDDKTGLAGSVTARKALESGDIDLYWEYTGTGWISYLGETKPISDPQKQYQAVADRDLAENKIRWLTPAPFNDTYAFAVREDAAADLGVKSISDFADLIASDPDKATICIGEEFSTRDDGLPGVEEAYGFKFPEDGVAKVDEGLIYNEVKTGDGKCNFGEVFQTDGRIKANKLSLIEDDKGFFPVYNPSVTVRDSVATEYPGMVKLFDAISAKLDTATMQRLNAQVDVDGEDPEDIADEWLQDNGFTE